MKPGSILISSLFGAALYGVLAISSCASSKAVAPVKQNRFGIDTVELQNFFGQRIRSVASSYSPVDIHLPQDSIAEASKYVWSIWKKAVEAGETERLPQLSDHASLQSWDSINAPDGTWQLPDGPLKFFYGSKGTRPQNGYPLIIFIHGSGADAVREWEVTLAWTQIFNDSPSAYFIPQSPKGGTGCRWYQPSRQEKWEQILRQALVGEDIDPNRIYFAGISEGGYGSQRLASFYSDYLAGAGPIAGGEMLANCPPENLANTPFILQTGELDEFYGRKILTGKVGKTLDELASTHPGYYIHKVDLQPEKSHGCDYTVTTPWLVKHTRNANPKYVYWENFGQGGINDEPVRYRDGFYNLYILKPTNDRTDHNNRAVYEMNIEGNTVNLNVSNVKITTNEPTTVYDWTGNLGIEKEYAPADSGKVRIYLNDNLVDLSKPVKIMVNGVEKFNGKVETNVRNIIESIAAYYDPARIFPAAVDVDITP